MSKKKNQSYEERFESLKSVFTEDQLSVIQSVFTEYREIYPEHSAEDIISICTEAVLVHPELSGSSLVKELKKAINIDLHHYYEEDNESLEHLSPREAYESFLPIDTISLVQEEIDKNGNKAGVVSGTLQKKHDLAKDYFAGKSIKEIAAERGLKPSYIKNIVRDEMAAIRSRFEKGQILDKEDYYRGFERIIEKYGTWRIRFLFGEEFLMDLRNAINVLDEMANCKKSRIAAIETYQNIHALEEKVYTKGGRRIG